MRSTGRTRPSRPEPLRRRGRALVALELVPAAVAQEKPPCALHPRPDEKRPGEHEVERGEQEQPCEPGRPVEACLNVVRAHRADGQRRVEERHEGERERKDGPVEETESYR